MQAIHRLYRSPNKRDNTYPYKLNSPPHRRLNMTRKILYTLNKPDRPGLPVRGVRPVRPDRPTARNDDT
jgi:hypothetical protein